MKHYALGLTCLLVAGVASAQMPSPAEMVKQLDKNGDGTLSKDEVSGLPFPVDFEKADTDKDSKLTAKEFDAYMKANMPPPPK